MPDRQLRYTVSKELPVRSSENLKKKTKTKLLCNIIKEKRISV